MELKMPSVNTQLENYQEFVWNIASEESKADFKSQLMTTALGLSGESGEFGDHLKKVFFQGHEIDKEYLEKELGDIMWYVAFGATTIGTTIDHILQTNYKKLRARYPEGFSAERSINRESELGQSADLRKLQS